MYILFTDFFSQHFICCDQKDLTKTIKGGKSLFGSLWFQSSQCTDNQFYSSASEVRQDIRVEERCSDGHQEAERELCPIRTNINPKSMPSGTHFSSHTLSTYSYHQVNLYQWINVLIRSNLL